MSYLVLNIIGVNSLRLAGLQFELKRSYVILPDRSLHIQNETFEGTHLSLSSLSASSGVMGSGVAPEPAKGVRSSRTRVAGSTQCGGTGGGRGSGSSESFPRDSFARAGVGGAQNCKLEKNFKFQKKLSKALK